MLLTALILRIRHLFYDKGWKKSTPTEIPSVCVGNLSVGGTGKTPFVELIIRTVRDMDVAPADAELYGFAGSLFAPVEKEIAVLSRGYRRKTKGFAIVKQDGKVADYGDEPLQIKRKFPSVVVAVDADRARGAHILAHPDEASDKSVFKPDIIILDDAYQHRSIRPSKSILLTTFSRPYSKDLLIPLGRLRDLRSRAMEADMIVVTKCPTVLDDAQRNLFAQNLGLTGYDVNTCKGMNVNGKEQILLFATTVYDKPQPVFPDCDTRYAHSKSAVLFTGIADDMPFQQYLCETYHIADHFKFPDHHYFSKSDISKIQSSASRFITAIVVTTEKDAQRLKDQSEIVPEDLRHRLFYVPIHTTLLSCVEQNVLSEFLSQLC